MGPLQHTFLNFNEISPFFIWCHTYYRVTINAVEELDKQLR